jgi:plasmid stabilization system protein ParE
MYELSQAAAVDIEGLLENSMGQFGFEQTLIYYQSLRRCPELLAGNPAMGGQCRRYSPGLLPFSAPQPRCLLSARG